MSAQNSASRGGDVRAGAQSPQGGLFYAIGAYLLWGVFPLYFLMLAPAGPFEIVAWRVIFSFVFCVALLVVTGTWRVCLTLMRDVKTLALLGGAGLCIFANWQIFVIGTLDGQVVDVALGYFMNPVMTILLGVLVLGEKLRRVQWVAVGLGMCAIVVLSVGQGQPPWIALALALSFSLYGLVKKRVGTRVDAISGLTIETLMLLPVASGVLVFVASLGLLSFGNEPVHTAMLVTTGLVTAMPLLFFAAAARRLPLVYLGFVQYMTPVLQLIAGVFLLGEQVTFERWIGFGFVWMAILVLIAEGVVVARRGAQRRSRVRPAGRSGGNGRVRGADRARDDEQTDNVPVLVAPTDV